MSKMKRHLEETGQLPMGTEEDGVVSMLESDYKAMEKELDAYEQSVELLRSRLSKIILDNFLDEMYDIEEECCICDGCIANFQLGKGDLQ